MKSNKFLKKLIVAVLSLGILLPAGVSENHNFAQAVTNGWHKNGSDWYYYMGGKPLKNQWYDDYYLKSDGKMAKNEWVYDNNRKAWYFCDYNGKFFVDSWITYKGYEYYLAPNGMMVHDDWVDYYYYVKSDGKMARDEWIYDKRNSAWYYLDYKGKFLSSVWKGDYYLKSDGKMAHDEWIFDISYNAWYYLKKDGKYARNEWIGKYYFGKDGKWVK